MIKPPFLSMFQGHTIADLVGSVLISVGGIVAVIFALACMARVAAWSFVYALKYLSVYRRCYVGWKFYALHREWIERDPLRRSWGIYTSYENKEEE